MNEDKLLCEENVLKLVGARGGAHDYIVAAYFNISNNRAREFLDALYSQGLLRVCVSPKCDNTGEYLLVQEVNGVPLKEYHYKCEDMDGECVYCGEVHSYGIEDLDPFFMIRDEYKHLYPKEKPKKSKQQQKIEGLIEQIDEMHRLIVQLKEGALANRYTARIYLEVDDPEGNYYVGPEGYWRTRKESYPDGESFYARLKRLRGEGE